MKKKHFNSAAVLFIFLIFTGTVICGVISVKHAKQKNVYKISGLQPETASAENINTEKLNRLIKEMSSLSQYKQRPGSTVPADFRLFSNFQPALSMDTGGSANENAGYHLSFAFSSETQKFCVINGRFYSEGGTLPDGAFIDTVEAERVLVSKNKLKKWLAISGSSKKNEEN